MCATIGREFAPCDWQTRRGHRPAATFRLYCWAMELGRNALRQPALGRYRIQAPRRQPTPGDSPMPADTVSSAEDELDARTAKMKEAIEVADKAIRDAAKRIDKAVREGVETLRTQSGPYRENATQQFDEAQKYVVERIKERPVVATLAGLGVGLLLGLLMASRSDK